MLVIAVLVVEIVITLMDFVEEDLSRKLPASERINHTLLAINYGAILMLLLPVLIEWAAQPTGVTPAYAGLLSIVAAAVRGWRGDLRRARFRGVHGGLQAMSRPGARTRRRNCPRRRRCWSPARPDSSAAGSSRALTWRGHRVIALVRNPAKAEMLPPPITLITSLDQLPDDSEIDAIVNLAGEPIGNGLWTEEKRRRIIDSRINMTGDIVQPDRAARRASPTCWSSGSAIGWYGLWQDQVLTEVGQVACLLQPRTLRGLGAGGAVRHGARRARGQPAHRPRARHRGRLHHAAC